MPCQRPAGRSCDDARGEDEPGRESCSGRTYSLMLEQRHGPVSGDDRETERGRLKQAERDEPGIAQNAIPGVADAWETGRRECRNEGREREEHGAPVRRPPAVGVGQRRHDHEGETATGHGRYRRRRLARSVPPPPARTRSRPATKPAPVAEPDDGSSEQRELEAVVQEEDRVSDDDHADRERGRRARARGDPRDGPKAAGQRGA